MTKKFTEPLRKKIKELNERASNLELIADELDKFRIGELIGVEYKKEIIHPFYVGNYKGIISSGFDFKIKLGNFAFIISNVFSSVNEYKLCNGKEQIEKIKELYQNDLERIGNILYPVIHDEFNIIKESEINQSLQKYGFSIEDCKAIFQSK